MRETVYLGSCKQRPQMAGVLPTQGGGLGPHDWLTLENERKAEVKLGIIWIMRFLLMLAFLPVVAFGVTVGSLPVSEYADTEVSTNIPFAVSIETMSRMELSLSLGASPTNNVEVSVGTDENGDGRLSTAEAAWTFGYDCGRWFTRNADENREIDEPASETGRITRTFLLRKRRLDPDWNLVKVVRRGVRSIGEIAVVTGSKPGIALEVR